MDLTLITSLLTSGIVITLLVYLLKKVNKNAELICFLFGYLDLLPNDLIPVNPHPKLSKKQLVKEIYTFCVENLIKK